MGKVYLQIRKNDDDPHYPFLLPSESTDFALNRGISPQLRNQMLSIEGRAYFQNTDCINMFQNIEFDVGFIGVTLPEENADNIFVQNRNGNYCLIAAPGDISYIKFGNILYPDMGCLYYRLYNNDLEDESIEELVSVQIGYEGVMDNWNANDAYGDVNNQLRFKLYIFQKCYAFTCVYYAMFDDFISKLHDDYSDTRFKLNVLSIGCGAKTDALALKYATSDYSEIIAGVNYIGIDPGGWNESGNVFYYNDSDIYVTIPEPEAEVNEYEIGEYYNNWECDYIRSNRFRNIIDSNNRAQNGIRNINMVVFPNMLSEINNLEGFRQLIDTIKDVYAGHELYLLLNRNVVDRFGERIDDEQVGIIKNYAVDRVHFGRYISKTALFREAENAPSILNGQDDICRRYSEKVGNVISTITEFIESKVEVGGRLRSPLTSSRFIQYEIYKMVEAEQ